MTEPIGPFEIDLQPEPWRGVWRDAARADGSTLADLVAEVRRLYGKPPPPGKTVFAATEAAHQAWRVLQSADRPVPLEDAGAVASALLAQLRVSAFALQALSQQVQAAAGRGDVTIPDLPAGRGENLATALEGIVTVVFEVEEVVTRHGRRIVEQLGALGGPDPA